MLAILKQILKICLIVLMMVAPGRHAIATTVGVANEGHEHDQGHFDLFKTPPATGVFVLNKNTVLKINAMTTLQINSNLQLHSPVTGHGRIMISGDRKLSIHANGNSISRLVIHNPAGVELLSQLNIQNELRIEEGFLFMNDFNIVLNHSFVRLSTHTGSGIAFNGSGRIIGQSLQPLAGHAPQYDNTQAPQLCLSLIYYETPDLKGTQIRLHNSQNYHSSNPPPPTPPPD